MDFFNFFNKIPNVNEIKGSIGEWLAKVYSKILTDALVLYDVLIDGADGFTSQIDLILIGHKGVYVVEMKMFGDAIVYGDTIKPKWYYYKHGIKYEIYSPIKQNQKHIEYLRKLLKDFGNVPCFSIIVMICDDFKVSGLNGADTAICNSLPAMKKAIFKISEGKPEIFNDIKKQEIFEHINNNQYTGKDARLSHKQRVITYKEGLEAMEKTKICPYC